MEKSLDERITENLRFEINHCGKSRVEIAKALGIKPASVSQWCSGRAQPTLANLSKLCSFIGCSTDEVLEIKKS